MKYKFDIELTTLHVGGKHRVVTLRLQGSETAESFLDTLAAKNKETFNKLMGRLKHVSNVESYEHKINFRSLGGGLFEAKIKKPKAVRLYVFYDRKTLGNDSMILAAHGGEKKTQKRDIENARARMQNYQELLKKPDTTFNLMRMPNENHE